MSTGPQAQPRQSATPGRHSSMASHGIDTASHGIDTASHEKDTTSAPAQQCRPSRQTTNPKTDASTPAPAHPPRPFFSRFSITKIPGPVKTLFNTFPLVKYPADPLPYSSVIGSGAAEDPSLPRFFAFQEQPSSTRRKPAGDDDRDDSEDGSNVPFSGREEMSYNPVCLRHQAYLKFRGIPYVAVPSNNHASPTGSLPFIIFPRQRSGSATSGGGGALTVPSSQIARWADKLTAKSGDQANQAGPEPEPSPARDPMHDAYMALIDHRIRRAWLFSLYLTSNFDTVVTPLYINSVSNSRLVRSSISRSLRHAAQAELLKPASSSFPNYHVFSSLFTFSPPVPTSSSSSSSSFLTPDLSTAQAGAIDASALLAEAKQAFAALDQLISDSPTGWLSRADKPGELDAALFGYVHLLLAPEFIRLELLRKAGSDPAAIDRIGQRPHWSSRFLHDALIDNDRSIKQHWDRIVREYFIE